MSRRDDQILEELHETYTSFENEWADIRTEGNIDARILIGQAWEAMDPIAARQRRDAHRLMLAPDEIGQYVNQVVNEIKANPRAAEFAPTGNGANDKGARFYENKAREIEYRSHATMHNTAAFEQAVVRSYGFTRVSTQYVHSQLFDANRPPDTSLFNQDIWIEGFSNPDMVLPDPFAQRPDLSDQGQCFVKEWLPVREFKRQYPGATVQSFTPDVASRAPEWFSKDLKQLLTAEYWTKEVVGTRRLLLLKAPRRTAANPQAQPIAVYADTLKTAPDAESVVKQRDVPIHAVTQYLTNGVEVLKTTRWPGQYIPIASCFGKTIFVDAGDGAKRHILSMIRLARDPFMLYAYIRSCQAELVGQTPKFPYFYYRGTLKTDALDALVRSVHEPVAGIPVEPTVDGLSAQQVMPFPQRNPYDAAAIVALDSLAEAARRSIQAAMGITPLPTPLQRESQKSGRALQKIEESGQRGSFHFRDSYENMIRFQGVIIEDLIDKVIDTDRQTGIREPDGTAKMVRVNSGDLRDPDAVSTKGDYQVTISTGPDFDSEREAASDFVDNLLGSPLMQALPPPLRNKLSALAIRVKNLGALGDEMADALDPKPQGPADPKQLSQENLTLKQHLQEVTQMAQKMAEELKTDRTKVDGQIQIKRMDLDFQREKMQQDSETKITVAELGAKVDRLQLYLEERNRVGLHAIETANSNEQSAMDRTHDVLMADMGHQQALQQGQQANQAAMAQQATQAALTPAPTEAGA